jgi:hypothetical protein
MGQNARVEDFTPGPFVELTLGEVVAASHHPTCRRPRSAAAQQGDDRAEYHTPDNPSPEPRSETLGVVDMKRPW